MGGTADITLIAFDMYGTLARNDASSWEGTFRALALEQGLAVSGEALRTQW
ncbi:MAG: hypothetical protein IIC32_07190, partial [Chloroflexi bacterium]|nr:hypothetical protein [Chloroflexota bacterium]